MEKWELHMKGMNSVITYSPDKFNEMEEFCKEMIEKGTDNLYEIKYYPIKGKVETCDIDVYF
jgi:hypothetical protein